MPPLPPWAMKLILQGVLVLAVMSAGAVAWDRMPLIGPHAVEARLRHDRDAWKETSAKWQVAAAGWQASFRSSETIRTQETGEARSAVNQQASACEARVAAARHSMAAIQALTRKEPSLDPSTHCPVRSLMPSDGLRDATAPARPG